MTVKEELCNRIAEMNEEQIENFRVALIAMATLSEEDGKKFHDMVIHNGISVYEAADYFGVQYDDKDFFAVLARKAVAV